jgi:hypothetical protein
VIKNNQNVVIQEEDIVAYLNAMFNPLNAELNPICHLLAL